MSDLDTLDWDSVLGGVEEEEKENPSGSSDFEAIPKGEYDVVVQEAEKQVSKTGKDMIKVRLQITSGPYVNRILWNYIVFSKDNPKAMRLTLERLAAFGVTREFIATQKPNVTEIASVLEGRQAIARVDIQKGGDYDGTNEVKGFKPLDGVAQPAPQVVEAKPAGVPSIPVPTVPAVEAAAPVAPAVPQIPVPAAADADDPFGG